MGQTRGRSGAKKEKELVKALKKDMKGKKIDPRTGRVVQKGRQSSAPKPPNKRSGTDYVGR